jgi:hypothetical protein
LARETTVALPRLSSDNVSVSRRTGSAATALSALRFFELADEETDVRWLNIGESSRRQGQDFAWARRNVHVFSVVPPQQSNHVGFETPSASVGVGCKLVTEDSRKTDRTGDRCLSSER